MRRSALLIPLICGVVSPIASWSAGNSSMAVQAFGQGEFMRTFSVQPRGKLVMDVGLGSIEVKTIEDHQIVVEVFRNVGKPRRSQPEDILRRHEVIFEHNSNDLVIRARFAENGLEGMYRYELGVRYVVSIPSEFNIDLRTSGGNISVSNLRGEVRTLTSGGSLYFGRIEGPVKGLTSGGSINLTGCNGKTSLKTSGGGIYIASSAGEVSAEASGGVIKIENFLGNVFARNDGGGIKADRISGSIDASTSGGPVDVALNEQPKKNCRLFSFGGGITVELEETLSLNIEADVSGGSVFSELPMTIQWPAREDALLAKLNAGGPTLALQANGGSVRLRKLRR